VQPHDDYLEQAIKRKRPHTDTTVSYIPADPQDIMELPETC